MSPVVGESSPMVWELSCKRGSKIYFAWKACRWLSQYWLVIVLLEVDVLWVIDVEYENASVVSGKRNVSRVVPRLYGFFFLMLLKEMSMQGHSKVTSCCYFCWWKSGELGCRGSSRFLCVTSVVESFYTDLLQTIISYFAERN